MTGATGFLGREVLIRLLRQRRRVLVTTRARPDETLADAQDRLRSIVEAYAPDVSVESMTVAFADVTLSGLGLSDNARDWIEATSDAIQVAHGAAEVRFDLPYEEMKRQNVGGTQNVLEFCKALKAEGRLHRFDHVSTAYVAGDRVGPVFETEVDVGQGSRNAYERTKLEAEVEVQRAAQAGLPTTVHRPSIIVGDSRTGRASSFKVLYWPMKIYARGRWRTVFGRSDCPVDVVPVDYVADAMVHLFDRTDATDKTFHLTAGTGRHGTIASLGKLARQEFGGRSIKYVDPNLYFRWIRPWLLPILKWLKPDVARRGGVFLPYLRGNPLFDTTQADAFLAPNGIVAPSVLDYFAVIMKFAKDSNFGRASIAAPPPAAALTSGTPDSAEP